MSQTMPEDPDYDVSPEDHARYVEGENAERAKPLAVEIAGAVQVREFPARSWSADQAAIIPTAARRVANAHPARTRLMITNNGPDPAYLSSEEHACSPSSGYPLLAGFSITFEHTAPVWAICQAAEATTLAVAGEYRDGGK